MAVTIQLKQFANKAAPVPADIVYIGDSANSFDEVYCTISSVIGAYPSLLSIGGLTTAANQMIYTTGANTFATTPVTAFGLSVLALTAGVTIPTAGSLATWDANKNLSANAFIAGFTSIASAGGTTVLTVASTETQQVTGTQTQTINMPVVSTLVLNQSFTIINSSTVAILVNSSGGNLIGTVSPGSEMNLVCILTSGTSAASWYASSGVGTGQVAWTPVVTFVNQGDLSVVYNTQSATYFRIGNLVVATFILNFVPTYTTASGVFQVTGLPLTSIGSAPFTGAMTWGNITLSAGFTQLSPVIFPSTSIITLVQSGSTQASNQLGTALLTSGNNYNFYGTISYMI